MVYKAGHFIPEEEGGIGWAGPLDSHGKKTATTNASRGVAAIRFAHRIEYGKLSGVSWTT